MANVNLTVTEEATAAFLAAQEDKSVRSLVLDILNEEIVLKSSQSASSDVAADFDNIFEQANLQKNSASFVIFCEDDGANAEGARKWCLISWVPDLCRPKDKMLYSSSRDNMKRGLGAGYFVKDYYCNDIIDLKWSVYQQNANDTEGGPLSDLEQLKKEEAKMERDTATHSSAMAQLGFEILPDATNALVSLSKFEIAVVALALENEKVSLFQSPKITSEDLENKTKKLSDALTDKTVPAFVLYQTKGDSGAIETTFVYYCPENASIKLKMIYSTAKATVIDIATANAVVVSKVEEVSSEEELDELLNAPSAAAAAAAAAQPAVITRAAPPGRRGKTGGKKKFVPDE